MEPHTKVGVTALIHNNSSQVLLGLKGRAFSPEFKDKWVTPGGRVNFKERLEDAIGREVLEETGLRIMLVRNLPHFEIIHDLDHFVFFCFEAVAIGGELRAGDDLAEVRWFNALQLAGVADKLTPLTEAILTRK